MTPGTELEELLNSPNRNHDQRKQAGFRKGRGENGEGLLNLASPNHSIITGEF